MAQVRSRAEITGSSEFPLAYGGSADRAENSDPERKTEGSILNKKFNFAL
jgi:hypothetical protein